MTSTLQLTRYDSEDGIEILINSITGESFCPPGPELRAKVRSNSSSGIESLPSTVNINSSLRHNRAVYSIIDWLPCKRIIERGHR